MEKAVKNKSKSIISLFCALMLVLSCIIIPIENNTIYARAEENIMTLAEEGRNAAGTAIIRSHENTGYSFGDEWDIYSLIRSGINLTDVEKDNYYADIVDIAGRWKEDHKPTDIERVMIALSAIGKDVKTVGSVNMEDLLLSNEKLTEGSNELAFALIALKVSGSEVSDETISTLAGDMFKFQNVDGGFALFENGASGVDTTAMALQALSLYRDTEIIPGIEDIIKDGLNYIKIQLNTSTFDAGNLEATAQVIITLTSLGKDPLKEKGFSNGSNNTVSALMDYYIEGQGFAHTKNKMEVNKMATSQAFQALEAFRRFTENEPSFWNLNYEDTKPAPKPEPVPVPDTVPEKEEQKIEDNNEPVKEENVTADTENKDTVQKDNSLKDKQNSKKAGNTSKSKPSKKQDAKNKNTEEIKDNTCTFTLLENKGDLKYTIKAVRTDEEKLEKLKLEILKGSTDKETEENISKLAKNPFTFHFNTDKEFDTEILIEMETDLKDGEYLLMNYNKKDQKLELVQKVEVKSGKTKFVSDKGGDYCITEKASTESLLKEEKADSYVVPVVVSVIIAAVILVVIVSLRKKAKNNEK